MNRSGINGESIVATFLLGMVLFSPLVIGLFGADGMVFGVPLLYAYLFGAWALLIGLVALCVAQRPHPDRRFRQRGR